MIAKALVVLCALVSLVVATPQDGYAIQQVFQKGSNCNPATKYNTLFYAVNQCSYYNKITYPGSNNDNNFILIQGSGTIDCQNLPAGYNQQLGICVAGTQTDYIWTFAQALNTSLVVAGIPTYTNYGNSTTTKCSALPFYISQTNAGCAPSQGTTYLSFKSTCTTVYRYSDANCTTLLESPTNTLQNTCQVDSLSYNSVTSCGVSINTFTTTPAPPSTNAPTDSNGNRITTPQPTNADGTPVTTQAPTNADGTPVTTAAPNSAAFLSLSSLLVLSSIAVYLL